jgi:hypothetical protein
LLKVPFQRFQARFDDNSVLWVDKEDHEFARRQISLFADSDVDEIERREKNHSWEVVVNFAKTDTPKPLSFSLTPPDDRKLEIPLQFIDGEIPELERIGPREWIYSPTGETLSLTEVLERFFHWRSDLPEWWTKLEESIEIHLIHTQRLQSIRENDRESISYRSTRRRNLVVPTVDEYAGELSEIIRRKLAESAALSQSFDSTFPTRLVKLMRDSDRSKLTNGELQTRLRELDEKRSRLVEVGILDRKDEEIGVISLPSEEVISDTKDVLALYVQDVEKKLSIFDEIADKIGLFKEMIDKRFLYKNIVISKETGFAFKTQDGKALPLTALSSGEQHELVLLYQLLFKTKPNSLVLIDEPEISLHVAWQLDFLQDLQKITRLASFDILIATHSPQIINERWDLTVRLEEPAIL